MKKMSHLFSILVSLLLCATGIVSAQSFSLGARGGMSIPNLTNGSKGNPLSTGYSSRLAADFAIFGEFRISELFSIRPMIEYSQQGGKKNGFQAFTTPPELTQVPNIGPYVYADYNSTAKMNYLMVPVLAKFGWNLGMHSPFRLYIDVGPFAGYLLYAHQITSGSSIIYADPGKQNPLGSQPMSFDNNENIRDQLHHFNFGVSGNVGLSYSFDSGSIFIEGGGNYGFINIQKYKKDGTNHTGAGTVTIGYAYKLGL